MLGIDLETKAQDASLDKSDLFFEKQLLLSNVQGKKGRISKDTCFAVLEHLEKVYRFKKTMNPLKYYYYANDKYKELDEHILQCIFSSYFCEKLSERNAREMLQYLSEISKTNKHLVSFKNTVYDTRKRICPVDLSDDLVVRNINFNYNNVVDYDIKKTNDQDITLVQKTLQEILIPKNDPVNELHYFGFLERVGSCINYSNKHKRISLYIGDSNRGKNILSTILQSVYKDLAFATQAETLRERFGEANLVGKSPIIFEELGGKSFLNIQSKLKAITGGDKISCEVKGVQKPIESDEFGKTFGFCNLLPVVNLEDSGILKRIDIIELPNTFVSKEEYNTLTEEYQVNCFIKNEDLKDQIKNDYKGLEWFINASIKAYNDMRENSRDYVDFLTDSETMIKLGQYNPVQIFIDQYIVKTDNAEDELFNLEIRKELEEYLYKKGIYNIPSSALSVRIREALNNRYGKEIMNSWTVKSGTKKYLGFKLIEVGSEKIC